MAPGLVSAQQDSLSFHLFWVLVWLMFSFYYSCVSSWVAVNEKSYKSSGLNCVQKLAVLSALSHCHCLAWLILTASTEVYPSIKLLVIRQTDEQTGWARLSIEYTYISRHVWLHDRPQVTGGILICGTMINCQGFKVEKAVRLVNVISALAMDLYSSRRSII